MGWMDLFKTGLSAVPGLGPALSIGMGLVGGALGNRGGTTNTTQTTHGTQHVDDITRPEYDSKTQMLRDNMINAYMSQMEDQGNYFDGYQKQGLANINASTDAAQRQIANSLASRGIQGPMAGAGLSAPLLASMGQKSSFLNSIPQLEDQRRQQLLKDTSGFLSSLPIAQHRIGTTTNDSTTTGTNTTPSNMLGGAFMGGGQALAGLYGSGAFNPKPKVPGLPTNGLPSWAPPQQTNSWGYPMDPNSSYGANNP